MFDFLLMFSIAVLVGILRVYLGVHYPSDVVSGAIIGIGFAFIIQFYVFL